jgi:hypothetical protein
MGYSEGVCTPEKHLSRLILMDRASGRYPKHNIRSVSNLSLLHFSLTMINLDPLCTPKQ